METEKIEVVCKYPYCSNCKMLELFEQSHMCLQRDVNIGDTIKIEIIRK